MAHNGPQEGATGAGLLAVVPQAVQPMQIGDVQRRMMNVMTSVDSTLDQLIDIAATVPTGIAGSFQLPTICSSKLIDDAPLGLGAYRFVTDEGMPVGASLGSTSRLIRKTYMHSPMAFDFIYRHADEIVALLTSGVANAEVTAANLKATVACAAFRNSVGAGNLAAFSSLGYLITGRNCQFFTASVEAKGTKFVVPAGFITPSNMGKSLIKVAAAQTIPAIPAQNGNPAVPAAVAHGQLIVVSVTGMANPDDRINSVHSFRTALNALQAGLTNSIQVLMHKLIVFLTQDLGRAVGNPPECYYESDGVGAGQGMDIRHLRPVAGPAAEGNADAKDLKRRRIA